jgi:hypothetical protein
MAVNKQDIADPSCRLTLDTKEDAGHVEHEVVTAFGKERPSDADAQLDCGKGDRGLGNPASLGEVSTVSLV